VVTNSCGVLEKECRKRAARYESFRVRSNRGFYGIRIRRSMDQIVRIHSEDVLPTSG
jgi:hypothetical protein